jgi:hypothetical protein
MIEIKETTEEMRNRKSKVADERRNIDNGLMGVLRRDNDPTADPPRTKFLRRKNSDGDEVKKVGLRNNRHVVTYERQLAVGIKGRNGHGRCTLILPLGRHLNLDARGRRKRDHKKAEKAWMQKSKTRAQNAEARDGAVQMGFSRARCHF